MDPIRKQSPIAGALLLLFLCVPASADAVYDKCVNASDGTNQAFSACGADWMKREDDKLNAAWKRVFPQLEGDAKAALLAEQRAWNAFKEASCKFYATGDFGREGEAVQFPICRAGMVAARAAVLDGYGKFLQQR